jgi:hypothetical protein
VELSGCPEQHTTRLAASYTTHVSAAWIEKTCVRIYAPLTRTAKETKNWACPEWHGLKRN